MDPPPASPSPAPMSPAETSPPLIDADTILQQLAATIQTGIRSAADTLLHVYSTSATPPAPPLQPHINHLFSTLSPPIQRELLLQLDLLRHTILSVPPTPDQLHLARQLQHARHQRDGTRETRVDNELAAVRKQLTILNRQLQYWKQQHHAVHSRVIVLRRLSDAQHHAPWKQVVGGVTDVEKETHACVKGFQKGMAEVVEDEHAPLSSVVPVGMGVLDLDQDETQLKALTDLRQRLLA